MKSLKAGNKARKGGWHQRQEEMNCASQRDAWDVGAKCTDRRNRHRCRLTYTESHYYSIAAQAANKRIKELEKKTVSLKSLMNFWREASAFSPRTVGSQERRTVKVHFQKD